MSHFFSNKHPNTIGQTSTMPGMRGRTRCTHPWGVSNPALDTCIHTANMGACARPGDAGPVQGWFGLGSSVHHAHVPDIVDPKPALDAHDIGNNRRGHGRPRERRERLSSEKKVRKVQRRSGMWCRSAVGPRCLGFEVVLLRDPRRKYQKMENFSFILRMPPHGRMVRYISSIMSESASV